METKHNKCLFSVFHAWNVMTTASAEQGLIFPRKCNGDEDDGNKDKNIDNNDEGNNDDDDDDNKDDDADDGDDDDVYDDDDDDD